MASKKKTNSQAAKGDSQNKGGAKSLDDMSIEELRGYLAERESAAGAGADSGSPSIANVGGTRTPAQAASESRIADAVAGAFSVRKSLSGKKIFIIGGTGFLGRVMLYMFLKYVPQLERVYVLIRPTHGRTGEDRLQREVLESPVFTEADDVEEFRRLAAEKVQVMEGDASRPNLGMSDEDVKTIRENADAVFNTAGNVEFNPPLDLSLNANATATRHVLDFTETTQCKKYLHVSTCYVADRSLHADYAPETVVSDRVIGPGGNEVRIDPLQELEDAAAVVTRIKARYEDPDRLRDYFDDARKELRRMGREEISDRLVEKTAKGLRTMALREELVKEGKSRAERINRPNVYTYTKTLAELLVKAREDKIAYTIVRPSIVETALKCPFPGWNEGIQGSAPLIYMTYRGHRMLPSLSTEPGERREASLDIIPVDLVAAGSVLALCALLEGEQKPVYQLAAGPIEHPITPNVLLNIVQHNVRHREDEDLNGVGGWLRRNLQSYPVTKKTFQRFSSPRTLKVLTNVRDRLEKFSRRELSDTGQEILQRVQGTVERFYALSYMKNRIFSEFLPFMNHGYPTFENNNGIELWKRLAGEERDLFFFDPLGMDYIDYMEGLHMDAVFRWVFPVLDKRFQSIDKIGRSQGRDKSGSGANDQSMVDAMRAAFSGGDMEFRERLRILRRSARRQMRSRRSDESASGADGKKKATASDRQDRWVGAHLKKITGAPVPKQLSEISDADLKQAADHLEFISGVSLTGETLKDLGTLTKLNRHIERWEEETRDQTKRGLAKLPEEGVEVPKWIAGPTSDFLYGVQMWFYRNVMQVQISGQDNIPLNNNNVIIVANHSSHLDYGLVWYSLGEYARDMGILAAQDYFFDKFLKSTFFGNFLNLVPIERGDSASYGRSLRHAISYLDKGGPLLIFPEGTRSGDGRMRTFRHGLGYLVHRTGADVLPLRLYNTHVALPKGKTVVRSSDVRVQVGKLISFDKLEAETENFSPTKTYAHISRRLQDAVENIAGV
ncbi:MAG: SDR family oxidoreductase [bacterium]|nr:SDR family oxidoreductase [bacterium]